MHFVYILTILLFRNRIKGIVKKISVDIHSSHQNIIDLPTSNQNTEQFKYI
jgi:hypothetical protein